MNLTAELDYDANTLPPEAFDEVPEGMELVDGKFVEKHGRLLAKTGTTLKHAGVQNALGAEWRAYSRTKNQGGKAYTGGLCKTKTQQCRPDVAYVTTELLAQHGEPISFPRAFPLIAEIASPDDAIDQLFAQAQEYLDAGAEEVWILLPETQLAFIVLPQAIIAFMPHQTIATQKVLPGFSIPLAELFS
jgi:Uma2 family endonuclease